MNYQKGESMLPVSLVEPIEMMDEGQANDVFIDAVNDSLPGYVQGPQDRGDETTTTTAATSGSLYGSSRSSLGQEGSAAGRDISKSDEERIKEALMENHHLIGQKHQGLEKLEAYILSNNENAVPADADSNTSRTVPDEDFSLHLSRPTGTGSHQLALWIREVNLAVRGRPPLTIQTKSAAKEPLVTDSSKSRKALSPANRGGFSQPTLSPASGNQQHPSSTPKHFNGSSFGGLPLSLSKARRPGNGTPHPVHHIFPATENTLSHDNEETPRMNNSQVLMANIEGKYKSLRQDLIRDPTFDDPPPSSSEDDIEEEESEYQPPQYRRKNQTAQVHDYVSCNLAKTDPLRPPDFSVRDHFTLGPLSTQSSGILSANSWSTAESFDSGNFLRFPGKACGGLQFLCE